MPAVNVTGFGLSADCGGAAARQMDSPNVRAESAIQAGRTVIAVTPARSYASCRSSTRRGAAIAHRWAFAFSALRALRGRSWTSSRYDHRPWTGDDGRPPTMTRRLRYQTPVTACAGTPAAP